jgi:hypothetical protein
MGYVSLLASSNPGVKIQFSGNGRIITVGNSTECEATFHILFALLKKKHEICHVIKAKNEQTSLNKKKNDEKCIAISKGCLPA